MEKKIQEKKYCPVCGSTRIQKAGRSYGCLSCGSGFPQPKITKIKLPKNPKYIG